MDFSVINFYVALVFASAAIAAVLIVWVWRRRDVLGAIWFAGMMGSVFIWSFFYGLELLSTSLPLAILWSKFQYFGSVTITVFWLGLVLIYTGQGVVLTRRNRIILFLVPFITVLLVWTNEYHQLLWINPQLEIGSAFNTLVFARGLWYWVNTAYAYALFVISTIVLVTAFYRANRWHREQIIILLIFSLLVWLGDVAYMLGWTPDRLNLTPVMFTLSSLLLAWGLFRYHILDIAPIAREQIMDNIASVVVVLDSRHRVVDFNRSAENFFKISAAQAVGKTASELGKNLPAIKQILDVTDRRQTLEKVIPIAGEPRNVVLNIKPLHNHANRFLGHVVVLRDITEYRHIEAELRKLTRVVEQSTASILITDLNGNIEYINPTFTEVTGYTAEEAIGNNPRLLKSGKHPTEFYVAMWDELMRNGIWRGEIINRKKNGELYWELSTMFAMKDDNGNITHYAAVKQNITRQKEMEHALDIQHKQEEILNAILHIGFEEQPLNEQLESILGQLFSCPWLPISLRGGIFLMNDDSGMLELAAHRNLSLSVQTMCAQIAMGQCLCGRAAQTREIQFATEVDHRHEILYDGIKGHGHYNVPIYMAIKFWGCWCFICPKGIAKTKTK